MAFYCVFRRLDGRKTRMLIGCSSIVSVAQARDRAREILVSIAKGIDPIEDRKKLRVPTFGQFLQERYLPFAMTNHKDAQSTIGRFKVIAPFNTKKLNEVTPWLVENWRAKRLNAGKKKSTVNRDLQLLKAVLNKAVEWEVIESHGLKKVKMYKEEHIGKLRYLTSDEELAIRHALDYRQDRMRADRRNHNRWCRARHIPPLASLDHQTFTDHLMPMILLSMNTGIRQGALFRMRWDHLSMSQRLLTIPASLSKSGRAIHTPLNEEALKTLISWRDSCTIESELVFPSRGNAGGIQPYNNVTKAWKQVLKDAGISNFRWHDLRHHFASRLVMTGVDLNTVRELLGHSDIKMTLRYAHLAPHIKREAVERLDAVSVLNIENAGKGRVLGRGNL